MAKTSSARSIVPAPKYGGLYLVNPEQAPVEAIRAVPRRSRARGRKPGAYLLPIACGAMAMPLLWVVGQVLHALHF